MKCPRCMKPIGPDDPTCPSCGAVLVVERKPTRPDEEKGWILRHLASIMGRVGCALMIAQNALVLVAVAAFAGAGLDFLAGRNPAPDIAPVATLALAGMVADLVGLGLVAVALVVLGAGFLLLRRKDPFTEEEVQTPPITAAFPMAAGLLVFLWLLLTAVWRLAYPAALGRSAPQLLADFAAAGPSSSPAILPTMMALWIVAAIALFVASILLRLFVRRLPAKIFAPRSLKPSSWLDFTTFNLVITVLVAAFPLGWIGYRGFEIVYLTFLATKLIVIPVLGLLAYWTLLTRFDAYGKVSLLVPVMTALPPGASTAAMQEGERRAGLARDAEALVPAPFDDEMAGIDRVK